mgnify:CR=1 FL=1
MQIRIIDFVNDKTIHYYLAKHYGIIQKRIIYTDHAETWNLIRFNVIQEH